MSVHGYHINTAISILGLPDGTMKMQGTTVYVWENMESYSYKTTDWADTAGHLGVMPFNYTTSYDTYHSGLSTCKIKIATNPSGIIITSSFNGDANACYPYSYRLYQAFGR